MLYFTAIQSMTLFMVKVPSQSAPQPSVTALSPGPFEVAFFIAITVFVIIISIYALIKTPISIVKTSNKMVQKTSRTLAPTVVKMQHKKDTKQNRRRIAARIVIGVKIAAIVAPVLFALASGLLNEQPLDYTVALIVASVLAGVSVILFSLQYGLAYLLRIDIKQLW